MIRRPWVITIAVVGFSGLLWGIFSGLLEFKNKDFSKKSNGAIENLATEEFWKPPDSTAIPANAEGDLIRYGRELIAHTAVYLGPKGKVRAISNGMNCQNCHLNAGKVPFGNNYGAVATKYPTFRSRSGTIENYEKRVNDCIERSLNGLSLDSTSQEMRAIVAYLKWVGKDVPKGKSPPGLGLLTPNFLDRPADPLKGALVYQKHCTSCHGEDGEGVLAENGLEWKYPPLYGDKSYSIGAGLYRLSLFAGFVKFNMPYGTNFEKPTLTDEEAWDVAAYVNSKQRPHKDISMDWPDITKKPFDHPFGPYADSFPEYQHKFGPFTVIKESISN